MTTPPILPATCTIDEIGFLLGKSENSRYGYQLRDEGRLVMTEDGQRVLVQATIERVRATEDPAKEGVAQRHAEERAQKSNSGGSSKDSTAKAGEAYRQAKALRERYAALQVKLDYETKVGKLCSRDEVLAVVDATITQLRISLENLAVSAAPVLAAANGEEEVTAILRAEIEHYLSATSTQFNKLAQGALS